MKCDSLPPSAKLKLDLMFEGIRYTQALGAAARHAFPNFFPYHFGPEEHPPPGEWTAIIPYMLQTTDDTHACIRANRKSPWWISGTQEDGYELRRDDTAEAVAVSFEPTQRWMTGQTNDNIPRAKAGLTLHGDMLVINVAPGCEYFPAPKQDGVAMRCTFCWYGAPDERAKFLGQVVGQSALPEATYVRMQEVLSAALEETPIRHIYLVGGSLTDPREEGHRFVELARRVQEVNDRGVPVICGSGALHQESLRLLHDERLVDAVSFNLEVWSERLFARICPGKQRFIGYRGWIKSLENAVNLWGPERVYTAMVAGVEIGPELGLSADEALEIALDGVEDLCSRGILPVYSLYWLPTGYQYPEHLKDLRAFFERLQLGYYEIRRKHGLRIWKGFMCHRCSYMQLECDVDRGLAANWETT